MASGQKGGRVKIDIEDEITLTVQIVYGQDGGLMSVASDLAGITGTAAHRQVQFLETMVRSHAFRLTFEAFDTEFTISDGTVRPDPELVAFAGDLAVIEQRGHTSFLWPERYVVTVAERVGARFARLLLEGKTAAVPALRQVSLGVEGYDDEAEDLLHSGGPVVFAVNDWSLAIMGEELAVGDVMCFHPNLRAVDAEQALEDLRHRGKCMVHFTPADDTPLVMWLPELTGSEEQGPTVPWELPGVAELVGD